MSRQATTRLFDFRRYGDLVLALGVMAILGLMVLRLPTAVIDVLVAVNITGGVALLLIALYLPHPVAFNSFPSVLLIFTLFRLALSVATTRLILLEAHAGHIIDAFGNFVAGGNLVVGLVVFIIITLVQFIVIAKGAERVAEVAARFTLDAMPGKQMSIDSDLRSGLIDKDEAKRRRSLLERESQMNGALDGAMKFVKGDAIASIIIVVVNLLGGLTIGILQRGLPAGEAMQVYSILTIGEGMVAQVPALLCAMAAGLIVTRSAGDRDNGNLGDTIGDQILAHPRALLMTGVISLILAFLPGFPTLVFITLAVGAFVLARYAASSARQQRTEPAYVSLPGSGEPRAALDGPARALLEHSPLAQPLAVEISSQATESLDSAALRGALAQTVADSSAKLGIRFPEPAFMLAVTPGSCAWRISIFDAPVASGGAGRSLDVPKLQLELEAVLARHAERFVGVQEVSNLLDAAAEQYPALVKEVLRQIPAQRVAEVIRNLLREAIPVRNLRDVLEALAEWGSREKDAGGLTEFVRIHLKRYLTSRFADAGRRIRTLVMDGAAEEAIRRSLSETPLGVMSMLPPERAAELRAGLRAELARLETADAAHALLITTVDVRRHVRNVLEPAHPALSVISYQELLPEVEVQPLGTVRFLSEARE
jgi:type III secretion protein V